MEPISVSLLLLFVLSSPAATTAKGGDRGPTLSGLADNNDGTIYRHLLEDGQPQVPEAVTHGYMSNSELEKVVKEFGQRCANISKIYSIGRSVKGVPLWVIEISDKPGEEEAEPAFKFIGNVHGDEPVGRELLIHLANWLCDNYKKDSLATQIVNNVHLHILPTMNPDGFALRRRGNANNIDLNRDFPDQFYHMNDLVDLRQPETRAIMRWVKEGHFTASASLHGGALVANYPWDGSKDARYPIYGGMQDWNYIHGGCFELTLEISDNKWPKANELPVLWEHNRMSMLNLVQSLVKTGVHGRIYSSDKGQPLPASVTIKGIDYAMNAGKTLGDYHRMLSPGENYEVMVTVPGFRSKSTRIRLEDEVASLDFILDPELDATKGARQSGTNCDCSCDDKDKIELLGFLRGIHFEVYIVVFLFLCLLLKRKTISKFVNHRRLHGQKRAIVV